MKLYYVGITYWGIKESPYSLKDRMDSHQGIMLVEEDIIANTTKIDIARGLQVKDDNTQPDSSSYYYGHKEGFVGNEDFFINKRELKGVEYLPVSEEQYKKVKDQIIADSKKESITMNMLSVSGATNCKNYVMSIIGEILLEKNCRSLSFLPEKTKYMQKFKLKKHSQEELDEKLAKFREEYDHYKVNRESNKELAQPKGPCYDGLLIEEDSIVIDQEHYLKIMRKWDDEQKKKYIIACLAKNIRKLNSILDITFDFDDLSTKDDNEKLEYLNIKINETDEKIKNPSSLTHSISNRDFEDFNKLKKISNLLLFSDKKESLYDNFTFFFKELLDKFLKIVSKIVGSKEYELNCYHDNDNDNDNDNTDSSQPIEQAEIMRNSLI